METQNQSSQVNLPDEARILDYIEGIKSMLPGLIELADHERAGTFDVKGNGMTLISSTIELASSKAETLSEVDTHNIGELRKNYEMACTLMRILKQLTGLCDSVKDTSIVAGNNAFQKSLSLYQSKDFGMQVSRQFPGGI